MKSEIRIIKSSFLTGISEIILGIVMHEFGWHDWYFEQFKFFGILGIGMIFYAFWHYVFFHIEVKNVG